MPKRISDRERIVTYAMNASAEETQSLIDTLKAIQLNRFPREIKRRRPRTVKPVIDEPELPGMPPRVESEQAVETSA